MKLILATYGVWVLFAASIVTICWLGGRSHESFIVNSAIILEAYSMLSVYLVNRLKRAILNRICL